MEKNREYFKTLLAKNELDVLFGELFDCLNVHQKQFQDKLVGEKYDELILLSGKLNAAQESNQLGLSNSSELNTEVNRVNFAVLELLNDLPDTLFQPVQNAGIAVATRGTKQIGIPGSVGNGLFWMGSMIMMMIALGSMVQHNWITATITTIATLICLPPSYHFLTDQFKIGLSNSVRILLILVLTSIGLSFAQKTEENGGSPAKVVQPKD